jgi:hypothetical protein
MTAIGGQTARSPRARHEVRKGDQDVLTPIPGDPPTARPATIISMANLFDYLISKLDEDEAAIRDLFSSRPGVHRTDRQRTPLMGSACSPTPPRGEAFLRCTGRCGRTTTNPAAAPAPTQSCGMCAPRGPVPHCWRSPSLTTAPRDPTLEGRRQTDNDFVRIGRMRVGVMAPCTRIWWLKEVDRGWCLRALPFGDVM